VLDEDEGRGIHPHCDGKSPQTIGSKGVGVRPLRKRVRKRLEAKEMNDFEEIDCAASRRFIRDANAALRRG
jgi:hypothetical protein